MISFLNIMICTMLWERRLIVLPCVSTKNEIPISPETLVIVVQIIDDYFKEDFGNREGMEKTKEDEGWEVIECYYKK